jgi:hypothetical protein
MHHLPFYQISARSDFKSRYQVAILEKKTKCYSPELLWLDQLQIFIIGISNKYAWHNTQVFDLTYFCRWQRSKFKRHVLLLFDLEYSNIVLIGLHFYQVSTRIGLQILPPAGPLGNIPLHLGYVDGCTLPELIAFISLSVITFGLSRTIVGGLSCRCRCAQELSLDHFIVWLMCVLLAESVWFQVVALDGSVPNHALSWGCLHNTCCF